MDFNGFTIQKLTPAVKAGNSIDHRTVTQHLFGDIRAPPNAWFVT